MFVRRVVKKRYCQVNEIEAVQPIDGYIPLLLGHNLGARGRVESWRGSSLGPTLSVSGVSPFVPV